MRERLLRVVTNRQQLDKLYGEGYFSNLLKVLITWKSALATEGVVVEEPLLQSDDLPGIDSSHALKERLARLNRKPADAVAILGGPDVVPFFPICSPDFLIPIDGDTQILSDDPYVAFDRHNMLYKPECPIGRLPDGGPGHPELLVDLLTRAAAYHRTPSFSLLTPVGLTSAVWQNESRQIFGFPVNSLYVCPPHGLDGHCCVNAKITPEWLQAYNLHYYNAWGTRSNTMWYGTCDGVGCDRKCDHPRVPLLDANSIPSLSGAWILSEASYSAHIVEATQANLALQFLRQGAMCYIGATATAYCANPHSSLEAADQIARAFINGVNQNMQGYTQLSAGEILKRAKLDYQVRDNFDRKTLVEFVLFGDPMLIPFRRQSYSTHTAT